MAAMGAAGGIAVGFLFAGGLGWRLLGAFLTALRMALNPRRARQMRPFTHAWEARFGEIHEDPRSQPAPGVFPAWYRAWRKTGVSSMVNRT